MAIYAGKVVARQRYGEHLIMVTELKHPAKGVVYLFDLHPRKMWSGASEFFTSTDTAFAYAKAIIDSFLTHFHL